MHSFKSRAFIRGMTALATTTAIALAFAPQSHALGKHRPVQQPSDANPPLESPEENKGTEEIISNLDKYLALNPYIMALQKEFEAAAKPVEINSAGVASIGDGIVMGKRYECRIYYALTKTDAVLPSMANTWYRFQKFGSLFIDNLAFLEVGRIRTYAPNAALDNELWGQSEDKQYYESLRVTAAGDLIIEAFTPKKIWVHSMLGFLGLDKKLPELGQNIEGLALDTLVAGASGYVLSYTYCPKDHISQ